MTRVTGQDGKPLPVDFGHPWCGSCPKLKRESLESSDLEGPIAKFEITKVSLDEAFEVGKYYRLRPTPYVLFVDSKGSVVDRLLGFEPPAQFRVRSEQALATGEESPPAH